MSAIWGAWAPDWSLYDKVDFDGVNKIIYVHPDVTTLDIRNDIYTSWVDWVALRDNLKFQPAIRTTGLDPIGGGAYTGDVYFLINGWKLSIDISKVKVNGVLYSDDYDTAYYTPSLSPQYPATVSALVNTIAPVVSVDGIVIPTVQDIRQEMDLNSTKLNSIPSASQIASSVRLELALELSRLDEAVSSISGLTPQQEEKINSILRTARLITALSA